MNYTIKKLPKSQIEISVTLTSEEFSVFQEEALQHIASLTELPGFRLGKAPLNLVKEKIGAEKIREQAIQGAIQKNYRDILVKEKIDAIGHPNIAVKKADEGLEYTIVTTLFPVLILPDYTSIAKKILTERKEAAVEEKEIEESLQWLRGSREKLITVSREARTGDRVEIDFTVKDNGAIIEGGSSKNHPLILGEGKFIPGFEDRILGMKEKEEKDFSLTMPADYPNNLGGKSLDFHVIIRLIQERQLPELTDDFAKGLGNFSSLEELKKNIREGLMKEKEGKERERITMKIAEEIAKHTDAEIPDVLIERELEKMLNELQGSLRQMNMEFETYLEHIKKTAEDVKKEWRTDAEKRVRIALILRAIADKENIEPTEEEISAKANNSLDNFRAEGHDITKIDKQALAEYSKNILRNKKVFEFLEKI